MRVSNVDGCREFQQSEAVANLPEWSSSRAMGLLRVPFDYSRLLKGEADGPFLV